MLRNVVSLLLLLCALIPFQGLSQDTIVFDGSGKNLNRSIANQFTIYSSDKYYDFSALGDKETWNKMEKRKIERSVENLDFTTQHHYIHMILINKSGTNQLIYLETARPITNTVEFLPSRHGQLDWSEVRQSGDGIPFNKKWTKTNRTVLPFYMEVNDTLRGMLIVGSDGEAVTLPIIFWDKQTFETGLIQGQFNSGLFYGIFIFVIIIYATFFVLLKDRLFLLYTLYVAFSGLLQFALDGYVHQYIFTSGGYWTHHSVILIAGTTVFFALSYATKYLELDGRNLLISRIFLGLVAITTVSSLIPGIIFETCYPLINLFSLLSLVFLLIISVQIRRTNRRINPLFLLGLFLLLAGGMFFILGNIGVIDAPEYTQYGLKAGTLAEIICLSILMAGKYKSLQDEAKEAQAQLLIELERKNKITEEANIRLEQQVAERTKEIEQKRAELAEKNEDLLGSISYAQRIQSALLPPQQKMRSLVSDFFVFFQPKDILSGDFYWMEEVITSGKNPQRMLLHATADCTGHGVPGAFVSIVCNNLLKLSRIQKDVNSTGEALDFIDHEIQGMLNQEYHEHEIRDGMDVALCAINFETKTLYFSGAKLPLYLLRDGEIIVYKGDRQAIGNDRKEAGFQFSTQEIKLQSGDLIYTFSDGIPDQFGGIAGKKYLTKRLKEQLLDNAHLPMEEQKKNLEEAIVRWMGEEAQVDDMILMGVRIP
ncbi:SpoIIE family protein phosphatase [Crocinitomicaceae bacterium]|nr:SpoIIE family protein phosphatase [Crocinitomicaceae bacterium]